MTDLQREVDWNGDAYHRLSDMQFKHGMEVLETLAFRGDETVLDAGCGSGRITKEILARLPKGGIIGVDLSERMLETARREVVAAPGQHVEFLYKDLQTFRPEIKVDAIYSNMALHFVADHGTLFSNFAHILKPEGFIALQYGTRQSQHPSAMHLMDMMQESPYAPYLDAKVFNFSGGNADTDRRALEDAGFVDIDIKTLQSVPVPGQMDKMREFIRTTTIEDCKARLPENLRKKFEADAEQALSEAFGDTFAFEFMQVRASAPKLH